MRQTMANTKTPHFRLAALLILATFVGTAWSQEEPVEETPAKVITPAVEAILASNPEDPVDLLRAAGTLADLREPEMAKDYLGQVLAAGLDQQQLADLHTQLGGALFVKFVSRLELAPEGPEIATAVLAAAEQTIRDPARLAAMIEQLQDPSPRARLEALEELRKARVAAVSALVAILADSAATEPQKNVAHAALVQLRSDARKPLLAVLESGDVDLVAEIITILAEMDARESAVFLLAPLLGGHDQENIHAAAEKALVRFTGQTPSKQAAVMLLTREAERYFGRARPQMGDGESPIAYWVWDDEANQLVEQTQSDEHVCLRLAAQFARDAYHIDPEDEAVRLLFLTTQLEKSASEKPWNQPADDAPYSPTAMATELGTAVVEQVLDQALQDDHAGAAMEAARILGQIGSAEELLYDRASPSPLVQAAGYKDRRVRFTAIEAITALNAEKPFAGSSTIAESAAYLAASTGSSRVLIAGPVTTESLSLARFLTPMGYSVETATSGRDLTRLAIASADCELVLIDPTLQHPAVALLLQQLRHDNRTAILPIGLIAKADQLSRAQHIARRDPLAMAFPRPHSQESADWQVERLTGLVSGASVDGPGRLAMAAQALAWLAEWNAVETPLYRVSPIEDDLMASLYVPQLTESAVALLATIGTPTAQTAILDLASRFGQPVAVRVAAAEAAWDSVERHGILLNSAQIGRQYDRYNESEHQDKASQEILGSLLDCLEAPLKAAGE